MHGPGPAGSPLIIKPLSMHQLFRLVLGQKDLSRAGDLFSLEDSEIEDSLTEALEQIKIISSSSVAQLVKNPPANAGDTGLIPELGRSPGVGNGNPLQYSYLKNPVDREACLEPGLSSAFSDLLEPLGARKMKQAAAEQGPERQPLPLEVTLLAYTPPSARAYIQYKLSAVRRPTLEAAS
ncbi:hypothetical protein MG293_000387 [Ovis ammon polii]|uniref:Uncharacterized protein n=1 Tax=Ovis ammon polii TaxID=230172 RepID=A0AAD4UK85_OVIAM|nr:hypothetical protein MG293_000387 [Ovis ammon polii]